MTRGRFGAIALTPEADFRVRTPPIDVVSARGAGDAFLAGLLFSLRKGEPWPEALKRAGAAGTACCLTPRNTPPTPRDLMRLMNEVTVERVALRTPGR